MIGKNQIEVTIKLEPFIFNKVSKMAEKDKRTFSHMVEMLLFERIGCDITVAPAQFKEYNYVNKNQ